MTLRAALAMEIAQHAWVASFLVGRSRSRRIRDRTIRPGPNNRCARYRGTSARAYGQPHRIPHWGQSGAVSGSFRTSINAPSSPALGQRPASLKRYPGPVNASVLSCPHPCSGAR